MVEARESKFMRLRDASEGGENRAGVFSSFIFFVRDNSRDIMVLGYSHDEGKLRKEKKVLWGWASWVSPSVVVKAERLRVRLI